MFWRLFCFRLKQIVRNKGDLFWILFFPLILGSMFYFSFGSMLEGNLDYEPVKTAVVLDKEGAVGSWFEALVEDDEIEEIMLPEIMEEKEAVEALKDGEVEAVIYAEDELTMEVAKEGISSTVLKIFLDTCLHRMEMAKDGIDITNLTTDFIKEGSLTKGNGTGVLQYFYALIAMGCLYGCFTGLSCVKGIMPNITAVGARRSMAPVSKLTSTVADFLATVTVQVASMVILLFYLIVVLKIELYCNIFHVLLVCIAGCMIGVAYGFFIGGIARMKEGVKNGLLIGVTMLCCFFSGLMFSSMKGIVEKNCPLFNRINPAALITDAFYALQIDNMQRYYTDLGIISAIAAVLILICFIRGRREKFASL